MSIGHSRYSTNTLSAFPRVQPFSILAHNGEINTIARLREEALALGATLVDGGSDSQDLDRWLQTLICRHGYDLMEAMEIVFPPVPSELERMPESARAVYRHYRRAFGPFAQGPAAVLARYGDVCVFSVDALGLRPLWFGETDKEYFFSSEKGVIPLEAMINDPRPLSPGEKMAAVVKADRPPEIWQYEQIRAWVAGRGEQRMGGALSQRRQPTPARRSSPRSTARVVGAPGDERLQAAMGWEREDLDTLDHWVTTGAEPIGSLGYDGPLAALAPRGQNVADYFNENVAVVTNPAIDREREMEHFSLQTIVGRRPEPRRSPDRPVHRACHAAAAGRPPPRPARCRPTSTGGWPGVSAPCCWRTCSPVGTCSARPRPPPGWTCRWRPVSPTRRRWRASRPRPSAWPTAAPRSSSWTTRPPDGSRLWLDPAVATGAVDVALRSSCRAGLRRHAARARRPRRPRRRRCATCTTWPCCVGLGADAVAPYLLWETAAGEAPARPRPRPASGTSPGGACTKGIEKVITTMGIHELRGYGRLFAAVGLSTPVAEAMGCTTTLVGQARGLTWDGPGGRVGPAAPGHSARQDAPEPQRVAMPHFYPTVWKKAAEAAAGRRRLPGLRAAVSRRGGQRPDLSIRHLLDLRGDRAAPAPAAEPDTSIHEHSLPIYLQRHVLRLSGRDRLPRLRRGRQAAEHPGLNGEGGEIADMLGRY